MQVIIGIAIFIVLLTVIIYKVNERFEKREFFVLISLIIISTIAFLFYEYKKENFLPNLFIEKYEKTYNQKILSLDFELLNNKVVSSKDEFIYKFIYTINKDNSESLCSLNGVKINKIKSEYIFIDFENLKEECHKN